MKPIIHRLAAVTALLCISLFFTSTLIVELFGSLEDVARVKSYIVMPGLFILIPAIAATGATGFMLSKTRKGLVVERKKKRMPLIAANGLIILLPAAIVLNQWAAIGRFDAAFYGLQIAELIAGATNITLMILSIRDGRKLRPRKAAKS